MSRTRPWPSGFFAKPKDVISAGTLAILCRSIRVHICDWLLDTIYMYFQLSQLQNSHISHHLQEADEINMTLISQSKVVCRALSCTYFMKGNAYF